MPDDSEPENRAEQIGSRAQMRDGAKEFDAVPFFLQGIGCIGPSDDFHMRGAKLPFLAGGGGRN